MHKLTIIAALSLTAACGVESPANQEDQQEIQSPPPCASVASGRISTTTKISVMSGIPTSGMAPATAASISVRVGSWMPLLDGDGLDIPLNVHVGERLEQVTVPVFIGTSVTEGTQPIAVSILRQDSLTGLATDLGDFLSLEPPGQQTLVIGTIAAPGFATEDVVNGMQNYWVHIRYNQPPAGEIKQQSVVGGITLTTSLPSTSSSSPPSC